MKIIQNRRSFIAGLSATGLAGSLASLQAHAQEPQIETTSVRFGDVPGGGICIAPQYVASELLRAEGITDIVNVPIGIDANTGTAMADDKIDFSIDFASGCKIFRWPISF
jgi:NitT/TauT family transport system substrate-binding protein